MKKILLISALTALFAACSQDKGPKVLVLYYSQTNTTKAVAEEISKQLGADIEAIVPVESYGTDFQATIARFSRESASGVLPEIQPLASDVSSYDVIFIGYPVWGGTYALPIATLLENVDFSGKKVVPFCTFGSGGLDSSVNALKQKLTGAEVLPGYGVRQARIDAAPAEVERFLKEGGFLKGEVEPYEEFSDVRPVSEEESAIFDTAVGTYPMIQAKAENVSSRPVPGGTEYIFEARDIPRGPVPAPDAVMPSIKVYVLDLEGQDPVFTQVLR